MHETKVFILGISVPITATIFSFGLLIWTTGRYRNFNFSSSGFAEFFEIYRFPLWVLVGTAALTALSVALHRSRETAKQIEISNKQYQASLEKNCFENYIKHREDFCKIVNPSGNPYESVIMTLLFPNAIYKIFFPKNNYLNLDFTPDKLELEKLNNLYYNYLTKPVPLQNTPKYLIAASSFTHSFNPVFKHTLYKKIIYKDIVYILHIACTAEHEHSDSLCNEQHFLATSFMESLKCIYNLISALLSVLDPEFKPKDFCEQNATSVISFLKKENIILNYLPPL
ncbi:hypothetical protein AKN92_09715 [Thiopseudomonas alkaliphila]|nr:hypothetical protein AKN92_09715 [Thiopseudomonas alkaliphila]